MPDPDPAFVVDRSKVQVTEPEGGGPPPPSGPQITRFPYLNRAVVVVGGAEYAEWESVQVRHAMLEHPGHTARFTCSEMEPFYPANRTAFRIRPGDSCEVFLDGYRAITGTVITRQVAFAAKSHTVEIQVASQGAVIGHSSAAADGMQFTQKNVGQIAKALAGKVGVNVETFGNMGKALDRFAIQPGESALQAIQRAANSAGVFMSADENGNVVLSETPYQGGGWVIEGENILEGNEVIHSQAAGSGYSSAGQAPGNDEQYGAIRNLMQDFQQSMSKFGPGAMPQRIMSEMPSFVQDMLKKRGRIENNVSDQLQINVTATVLGWQRQVTAGGLWRIREQVMVDSPMLIMKRPLMLKAVTFTQNNQTGTRSTLELCNRAAMGGESSAS